MSDDRDFWRQAKETTEEAIEKIEEVGEIIGEKGGEVWEATADARKIIVEKANEIRDVLVEKSSEAWDEARKTTRRDTGAATPMDSSEDVTDEYPAYGWDSGESE